LLVCISAYNRICRAVSLDIPNDSGLGLVTFRRIYAEVVGAIPLNGGAYNVLLNTATKRLAAFAATLTILSCMAI
jgi:hypothetical protein